MAKSRSGLGRDFYSLLDDNILASDKTSAAINLRISQVEPRSDQPRKEFSPEALGQLADSIAQFGVLQPIIVRESAFLEGNYEIIAGERRWRASKMAGLSEIPAVILDGDDLKAAQIAVIENVQREDLNPVEEAQAYRALINSYNLTQEEVSLKVGKGRSTITNALRLLDLGDDALAMLNAGELSAGHARALLSLKDKAKETSTAAKIVALGLSVRAAEDLVRKENKQTQKEEIEGESVPEIGLEIDYYAELSKKAMDLIGRRVKINHKGVAKTVSISYEDNEDLEILLRKLCGDDIIE